MTTDQQPVINPNFQPVIQLKQKLHDIEDYLIKIINDNERVILANKEVTEMIKKTFIPIHEEIAKFQVETLINETNNSINKIHEFIKKRR